MNSRQFHNPHVVTPQFPLGGGGNLVIRGQGPLTKVGVFRISPGETFLHGAMGKFSTFRIVKPKIFFHPQVSLTQLIFRFQDEHQKHILGVPAKSPNRAGFHSLFWILRHQTHHGAEVRRFEITPLIDGRQDGFKIRCLGKKPHTPTKDHH